ncbi:flagellar assembly protein FliW [bacterium]|nr:flagellar assembly protein FliW [bacterium]
MNSIKITTKRFSEIDVSEDKVITVKGGILGFPDSTEYTFIEKDKEDPFKWFQSLQFGDLAFVLLDPFVFFPDYRVEISEELAKELDMKSIEEAIALVIVVIPKNPLEITANLLAPVILNPYKKIARQIILIDSQYTTKHYIIPMNEKNKGDK